MFQNQNIVGVVFDNENMPHAATIVARNRPIFKAESGGLGKV